MTHLDDLIFDPLPDDRNSSEIPSVITIGQKATGLINLPSQWQPSFFVLTSQLISAFRDCIDYPDISPDESLGRNVVDHILRLVKHIAEPDNHIILRSSSSIEGMNERGAFESMPCRADWKSIAVCLRDITSNISQENFSYPLAIIAQKLLNIKRASGHLSNERRISRRKTTWLWEFDSIAGIGEARVERFSSIGTPILDEKKSILCPDFDHLQESLRRLAAWAAMQRNRFHFEWIWDGEELWIVQADQSPEIKGEAPGLAFHNLTGTPPIPKLAQLERVSEVSDEGWQKLECAKMFRECGLPTTEIWILRDVKTLHQLAAGKFPEDLETDLRVLLAHPIVIRTDLRRSDSGGQYLLPRTDAISKLDIAKDFLISTASVLEDVDIERIAFFIHRFIPARSSAYAMAEPASLRVRIDGLWGLPDGLLYYPHDSYELSAEATSNIQRRVRFKDEYLDPNKSGLWTPKRAGSPWDWKNSLEDEELRLIASSTHRLAQVVGKPVQVMWFVGVPIQTGHPACLPWYFETEEPPHGLYSRRTSTLKSDSLVLRRAEDLRELRQRIDAGERVPLITIKPVPDLLRDRNFLNEAAELSKLSGASVELEGSILSHAYYILRRSGVSLLIKDPFRAEEDRKVFDKLVRDRVPDKIAKHGETAVTVRLSAQSLSQALKAKILEEALELFWAQEEEELKEELVDLQTVLDAFARQKGITELEISQAAEEKKRVRGGFEEGLVLRETIENPLISDSESPLLFGTPDARKKSHLVEETSASMEDLSIAPRMEGPNLVLPLIPPNPERRHLSHAFQATPLGITLNVRYREKEVVIELSSALRRNWKQGSPQISLFGERSDDEKPGQ